MKSALTGESRTRIRRRAVLSSGSVVRRGEGNGVVMLIAAKTYFGRTTSSYSRPSRTLHIEAVVAKVVRGYSSSWAALVGYRGDLSLIRGAPSHPDDSAHACPVDECRFRWRSRHVHGQHGVGAKESRQTGGAWLRA